MTQRRPVPRPLALLTSVILSVIIPRVDGEVQALLVTGLDCQEEAFLSAVVYLALQGQAAHLWSQERTQLCFGLLFHSNDC